MNILFAGPYRQNDGWGLAARDYLKALLKTKYNIACKPVFMAWSLNQNLLPEFIDAEKKVFEKRPDVIIQNILPHLMDYQYDMKNIGLCYLETKGLKHTNARRIKGTI